MGYDGTYGSVNGGYARSRDSQTLNYGARGGIPVHSGGVTFSQELGKPSRWWKRRVLMALP